MAFLIPPVFVLDRALRDAGIPIDGVSMGSPVDRSTWLAFYQASATAAQRTQGDALLQTLDLQDPTTLVNIKTDLAAGLTGQDMLIALGQAAYECAQSPTSFPTLVSFRNRFLTLLKGRL